MAGQGQGLQQMNGQHEVVGNGGPHNQPGFQPPQQTSPPLSDLMGQLEDYTPTIPDAVTSHYLASAGFDTTDPRLLRLVSLGNFNPYLTA
ncbi:transcription initiation factor TFIID subunit 10 [Eurytemora carolleeae]|uniref:transcription initiation factor TFIID subunit 10 n=1 Tax=Eurytemora carolleeae TaxID=1294199 RepID=UPI000C78377A|nr:transcription initiation factor TFIID subunit 10 [Eurytemora carolleeae]|eukprot:XP_023333718.1 transcription initiation factor TFIID subunit 10-like [Eurytemora affinis]